MKDRNTSLQYRVYKEEDDTLVPIDASSARPDSKVAVKHSRMITFRKVGSEQLAYLEKDCITFLAFIEQGETPGAMKNCVSEQVLAHLYSDCFRVCLRGVDPGVGICENVVP